MKIIIVTAVSLLLSGCVGDAVRGVTSGAADIATGAVDVATAPIP